VNDAALGRAFAGELWLEHGWDQAPAVRSQLSTAGFDTVRSVKDLAGIERLSGGAWRRLE